MHQKFAKALILMFFSGSICLADAPMSKWDDDPATPQDRERCRAFAQSINMHGYVVWESMRPTSAEDFGLKFTSDLGNNYTTSPQAGQHRRTWRIWKRNLNGDSLKMISGKPGVYNVQHFGPTISPDGKRVLFVEVPTTAKYDCSSNNPYQIFCEEYWTGGHPANIEIKNGIIADKHLFDLWVVNIDGSDARKVLSKIYCAGENRIAVWLDNEHAAVVFSDQNCYRVKIPQTGDAFKAAGTLPGGVQTGPDGLIVRAANNHAITNHKVGVLPSVDGRYAFYAFGEAAEVYRVDINTKEPTSLYKPVHRGDNPGVGCQTIISNDSKYFIVGKFGKRSNNGIDSSYNMKTGKGAPFCPTTPGGVRKYDYYPNLNKDNTLGAIGFAPNHSHVWADYDIFVFKLKVNSDSILQATGEFVQYSFFGNEIDPGNELAYAPAEGEMFGAVDRWPAIWAEQHIPTSQKTEHFVEKNINVSINGHLFDLPSTTDNVRVTIIDICGKTVIDKVWIQPISNELKFNIVPGIYVVSIIGANKHGASTKIVRQVISTLKS